MLLNFILPSVASHAENFSLFKRPSHPPRGRKIKIVVAAPRASQDEIKKFAKSISASRRPKTSRRNA
jgi:hypothetical protein